MPVAILLVALGSTSNEISIDSRLPAVKSYSHPAGSGPLIVEDSGFITFQSQASKAAGQRWTAYVRTQVHCLPTQLSTDLTLIVQNVR